MSRLELYVPVRTYSPSHALWQEGLSPEKVRTIQRWAVAMEWRKATERVTYEDLPDGRTVRRYERIVPPSRLVGAGEEEAA